MVKYICKNCNYRFDAENPQECNFCGMECIEKEKDAGELLREIEMLFR